MKNTILLLLLFGLLACKDDDSVFDISVPRENFRFKAIPGGAVMYYTLPERTDIYGIQVEYPDFKGEEVLKVSTYLSDSIVLDGFNTARQEVPVRVSMLNHRREESGVMELTFDTENSTPVAFFDQAEVVPYGEGFQVKYKLGGKASGFCNVFFVGTNPMTRETDTLLLETFLLETGVNEKYFALEQRKEQTTVVLKTEDFRGNIVLSKNYDIKLFNYELDPAGFKWLDPFGLSVENDEQGHAFGWKYLFDGDLKGSRKMEFWSSWTGAAELAGDMYTFLAGPFAVNKHDDPKYFILDIGREKKVASMRMYAMLFNNIPKPLIYKQCYANKLPNEVTVYASNNKEDNASWVEIGRFYQSVSSSDQWIKRAAKADYAVKSLRDLEAADPCYFTINFSPENPPYRYFKIEFNGIFSKVDKWVNEEEYVTLHELKVFGM